MFGGDHYDSGDGTEGDAASDAFDWISPSGTFRKMGDSKHRTICFRRKIDKRLESASYVVILVTVSGNCGHDWIDDDQPNIPEFSDCLLKRTNVS
jgi:hypothetical protein